MASHPAEARILCSSAPPKPAVADSGRKEMKNANHKVGGHAGVFLNIPRPCVSTGWEGVDQNDVAGAPQSRGTSRMFALSLNLTRCTPAAPDLLPLHSRSAGLCGNSEAYCRVLPGRSARSPALTLIRDAGLFRRSIAGSRPGTAPNRKAKKGRGSIWALYPNQTPAFVLAASWLYRVMRRVF